MKKKLSILITMTIFMMITNKCLSQDCDPGAACRPLPKMFIYRETGDSTINEFSKRHFLRRSKYKLLKKSNGTQDKSLFFNINTFQQLIKYFEGLKYHRLQVSFAIYNRETSPSGFPILARNNKLILLFYPDGVNSSYYYFINGNDPNYYRLDKSIGDMWMAQFVVKDMRLLNRSISKKDPDNWLPGTQTASDTKYLFFDSVKVHDAFICEPFYQNKYFPNNTITGIQVFFSRYMNYGRSPTRDDSHIYKKRLYIQFAYLKADPNNPNNNIVLHLEDTDNFHDREICTSNLLALPDSVTKKYSPKQLIQLFMLGYLDNGQLCPTICN